MELYILIAFILGLLVGIAAFYAGFRLGYQALYNKTNDLPLIDDDDDFEQEVTD